MALAWFPNIVWQHHLTISLPFWAMPLLLSSTTVSFFLFYILDTRYSSFLFLIFSPLLLYSFFHTLHIQLCFFLYYSSISILLGICYTTHFLTTFTEINACPWFSFDLVLLYSYPLYSTNVTTSYLVFYPLFSSTILLRDMPHVLLCSYTFSNRECTGLFSFYCAFCDLAIYATSSSYFLLFTSIFGIPIYSTLLPNIWNTLLLLLLLSLVT